MVPIDLQIAIFILDDNRVIHLAFGEYLAEEGIKNVHHYYYSEDFFREFDKNTQICVIDFKLNEPLNGLDILKRIMQLNDQCYVICISSIDNFKILVDMVNNGIDKFVPKSDPDFILKSVRYIKEGIKNVQNRFSATIELMQYSEEVDKIIQLLKNAK